MIAQMKLYENDSAVSVLVGTLALIAVVVAGTLGIATILGTFSTDVSRHANPDQSVAATQTPVYIAGADNMMGLTQSLATSFTTGNPSYRFIPGPMDPTGLDDAIMKKRIDVGALSGDVGYASLASDPDMKITQVGMSSTVVITNKAAPGVSNTVLWSDLRNFFNTGAAGGNINAGATSAVRSDLPETTTRVFYNYLSLPVPSSGSGNVAGNDAMVQYIATHDKVIGYADFSDAETAIQNGQNIVIVGVTDPSGKTYTTNDITLSNLAATDKNVYRSVSNPNDYNHTLCYPLYYITTTNTGGISDPFISFSTSTAARSAFRNAYAVSIVDL